MLRFANIDATSLDAMEASIGPSPYLDLFSQDSYGVYGDDPGDLLCRIMLPSDWLADASGGSKAKIGTWVGEANGNGDARSFRLKRSDGTPVIAGSVTATGGGGDLTLDVVSVRVGQEVTVQAWTFSFEAIAAALYAALAVNQAGQAVTSSAWVYQPIVATNDTWIQRSAVAETKPLYTAECGPWLNQGWMKGCLIEESGDIFIAQGSPSAAAGSVGTMLGTYLWRNNTGLWDRRSQPGDPWYKNLSEQIGENYDTAWDANRRRVWITRGHPGWLDSDPRAGDRYFDLTTEEFTCWRPDTANTYVPVTPEDTAHFNAVLKGKQTGGLTPTLEIIGDKYYVFGGWGSSGTSSLTEIDLVAEAANPSTYVKTVYTLTGPKWNDVPSAEQGLVYTRDGSGKHRIEKYLWTFAYDENALWILNLNEPTFKWRKLVTSGDIPVFPQPTGRPPNEWQGAILELHEDANCIVLWVARNEVVGGMAGSIRVDATWVLDLLTLRWRRGPSAAGGATMPPGVSSCARQLFYSPQEKLIRGLIWDQSRGRTVIWDFVPEYTGKGTLTSSPLIASSGGVMYVNNRGMPFDVSLNGCKHVNMAYCPLDNRIYLAGGDVTASAEPDATWSMDPNHPTGDWRFEKKHTDPGPHPVDAQDNMGWYWDDASNRGGTGRNKFLLVPGNYYRYVYPPDPLAEWTYGWWTFDPVTKIWEQFTTPWTAYPQSTRSQCPFGGAYNPDDDSVYHVGGASTERNTVVWSLTGTTPEYRSWSNATAFFAALGRGINGIYNRGMHALVNGNIYVLGTGMANAANGSVVYPVFFCYNIAANTVHLLSTPPVPGSLISHLEVRLAASGTDKIVWIAHNGPTGAFQPALNATDPAARARIFVYDIAQDYWTEDKFDPAEGPVLGNAVMYGSLPDGRVCFAGGGVTYYIGPGVRPTRFWMYNPAR